jgi:hypothetical protein
MTKLTVEKEYFSVGSPEYRQPGVIEIKTLLMLHAPSTDTNLPYNYNYNSQISMVDG